MEEESSLRKGVLVVHPGLQHSHQLAWALHERRILKLFWSGMPVRDSSVSEYWWLPRAHRSKIKFAEIGASVRRHSVLFPAVRRLPGSLGLATLAPDFERRLDQAFDWRVSRAIGTLSPAVVVAYENCAFHIFKAAKAIGAMCVLDAASVHHRFGSKNFEVRDTPHLAETIRRLDIEVANADLILTCSQIAADSYTAAGVPATKVRVFPLGASVQTRFPARLPHNNELHFLFAGVLSHRKSIDIILSVFSRLNDEGHKAHLTLAGGAGEDGWIERIGSVPNARYLCSMPQGQLHQLMAESDCLLLPSRVESFGMVVAEAMACGTPAIASTNTGASMLIRDFPGSGWIIEAREDALYQCILRLIENRQTLFNARLQAFKASERYSWNSYREEVGKLFSELVRK